MGVKQSVYWILYILALLAFCLTACSGEKSHKKEQDERAPIIITEQANPCGSGECYANKRIENFPNFMNYKSSLSGSSKSVSAPIGISFLVNVALMEEDLEDTGWPVNKGTGKEDRDAEAAGDAEETSPAVEPKPGKHCGLPEGSAYQASIRISPIDPQIPGQGCPDGATCMIQAIPCSDGFIISKNDASMNLESGLTRVRFRAWNMQFLLGNQDFGYGWEHFYPLIQDAVVEKTPVEARNLTALDRATLTADNPKNWSSLRMAGRYLNWNPCTVKDENECPDQYPPDRLFQPVRPWNMLVVDNLQATNPKGGSVEDVLADRMVAPVSEGGSRYNCCFMHTAMHPAVQALVERQVEIQSTINKIKERKPHGWGLYSVYRPDLGGIYNPLFLVSRPRYSMDVAEDRGIRYYKDAEKEAPYVEEPLMVARCSKDVSAVGFLHIMTNDTWDIYLVELNSALYNFENGQYYNLDDPNDPGSVSYLKSAIAAMRIERITEEIDYDCPPLVIPDCQCSRIPFEKAAKDRMECDEGDADEDEDTLASAKRIQPRAPEFHMLCPEGDVDYFSFQGKANTLYQIETVCGDQDTQLTIYDANEIELDFDDDGGKDYCSIVNFTPKEDGTYYIMVNPYDQDSIFGDVVFLRIIEPDQFENNDYRPTSYITVDSDLDLSLTFVPAGGQQFDESGERIGDVDILGFELVAGKTYTFETIGDGSVDTVIELQSNNGSTIQENDDYNDVNSFIQFECKQSGKYLLRIKDYYTDPGTYRLLVKIYNEPPAMPEGNMDGYDGSDFEEYGGY